MPASGNWIGGGWGSAPLPASLPGPMGSCGSTPPASGAVEPAPAARPAPDGETTTWPPQRAMANIKNTKGIALLFIVRDTRPCSSNHRRARCSTPGATGTHPGSSRTDSCHVPCQGNRPRNTCLRNTSRNQGTCRRPRRSGRRPARAPHQAARLRRLPRHRRTKGPAGRPTHRRWRDSRTTGTNQALRRRAHRVSARLCGHHTTLRARLSTWLSSLSWERVDARPGERVDIHGRAEFLALVDAAHVACVGRAVRRESEAGGVQPQWDAGVGKRERCGH